MLPTEVSEPLTLEAFKTRHGPEQPDLDLFEAGGGLDQMTSGGHFQLRL